MENQLPVDRLLAQHARILANVAALERLVAGPRPDRAEGVSGPRWTATRDLMVHLGEVEAIIYGPLHAHPRTDIALRAKQASARIAELGYQCRAQVARWPGFPSAERWAEYCAGVQRLCEAVRELLDAEVHDFVALVPIARASAAPSHPNGYAAEAWRLRSAIYANGDRPLD